MKMRKLKKFQQEKHGFFNTHISVRNKPMFDYDPFTGARLCRKGRHTGRFRIGTGQHPWRRS